MFIRKTKIKKMNFLLSVLLLGIVSHAHATGVTVLASWVTLLNENTGVIVLITAVGLIIFHISKFKWNAMESDVSELKKVSQKTQSDIDKLKKDTHNIKYNIDKIVGKLFSEKEVCILRHSPSRLTDMGKDIATKIGADNLLAKHWEYLKGKVNATDPNSNYDTEIASLEVAQEMDVVLSKDEKSTIKAEAFNRGIPYEEILSIIGVMLRDKLLEEHAATKIKSNPKNPKAYYSRGNTRRRLGNFQDAISDYDEAIRLNPEYLDAYNNRGNAKNTLGNFQDAISDFNEVIRLNPEYLDAYINRGNAKTGLGKFQDAISDCDEAIRLSPELSVAYYNRGVAKSKLGDKEDALADFTKAKELSPEIVIPDLRYDL